MLRGIVIGGKLLGDNNEDLFPAARGAAEANHRDRAEELRNMRPYFKLTQTKEEKEQVEAARLEKKAKALKKLELDALSYRKMQSQL